MAGHNNPVVDGLVVGNTFVVAVEEDSMYPGVVEEGIVGSLENHHNLRLDRCRRLAEGDTMVVGPYHQGRGRGRYGCLGSPTW